MLPIPLISGVPQDVAQMINILNTSLIQAINSQAPGLVGAALTSTGNGADTTEDVLQTLSLTPNLLNVNGKGLRLKAFGNTANNTDTKTLKLYHGTTVLSFTLNASSGANWYAEMSIFRTGAATQVAAGIAMHGTTLITPAAASGTDTLSGQLTAKVTGQASVANANDIVCTLAYLEIIQ